MSMHQTRFSHLAISLVVVAYNFVPHAKEPLSLSLLRLCHIINILQIFVYTE